ncbi:hypothetical protein DUPY_35000 [Duganella phyllosphaerae]|uniref:Flagellar assembly protein T N-terminal domain-containing protein n=2 Tax=Duganella phyllosphaerae TaxID=762836 RepID=A0A1E7WGS0_9BURK|nr:hypothetical protein DUPY_35000 [Duganella phyllosphaerae]
MMKKIFAVLITALLALPALAQVVTTKGVATITYDNKLMPTDVERAQRAAQVASIERYYAEAGEAESENFEAIRPQVEANLDKFIMSSTVLSEQDQPALRKYSVSVRTELNVTKLRVTLRGAAKASQPAGAGNAPMVYVFLGREVAAVKSFDDRVVKRAEIKVDRDIKTSGSVRGSEGESIKSNAISTNANKQQTSKLSASQTVNVETGGSTNRKQDEVTYRMLSMASHKTSVTSVFSQSGFTVADPDFVLGDGDMKSVSADFSHGSDLTPATMRALVASLRKAGVPLLVLATFDVGVPAQDPATGMPRVAVTVTGRVMDVSAAFPREVASVPPVQYFAVAPDGAIATTKALKDASLLAAKEIVSRLNAAGVR